MSKNIDTAAKLRVLALVIRNNPEAREAIADSIELIAGMIEAPCTDCGHPDLSDLPVIDHDDNPATGA